MKTPGAPFVFALALAGCGEEPPTLSTPLPPVTTLLSGTYDLVVKPDAACGFPGAPYTVRVEVVSGTTGGHTELRATLPGGDPTLGLEMLYDPPGFLGGSIGTRNPVVFSGGAEVYLRNAGSAAVSLATGGRAEVAEGTMAGDIGVSLGGQDYAVCSAENHGWELRAR